MWIKQCLATTKRGARCKRRSTWAVWTFRAWGEKFNHPTWVESCGHHLDLSGQVALQDIRHFTKGN